MNRFVIIDGLPFLYANGKTYSVRWDEAGFTVGAEVEKASVPDRTYSELSVKAKCSILDSIGKPEEEQTEEEQTEEEQPEEEQTEEPIEEMTVAELKEYASQNGIDLDGVRNKAAILEIIQANQNQAVN